MTRKEPATAHDSKIYRSPVVPANTWITGSRAESERIATGFRLFRACADMPAPRSIFRIWRTTCLHHLHPIPMILRPAPPLRKPRGCVAPTSNRR